MLHCTIEVAQGHGGPRWAGMPSVCKEARAQWMPLARGCSACWLIGSGLRVHCPLIGSFAEWLRFFVAGRNLAPESHLFSQIHQGAGVLCSASLAPPLRFHPAAMACYAVRGSVATLPALRAPLTAQADAASGRYEDGSGGQAKEAELRGRGTRGSNEACELRRVQRP